MTKKLLSLLFVLFFFQPALADQATFQSIMKNQLGYPLEANITERLVTIEATPRFWSRINGSTASKNSHPVKYLKSYSENLALVAENLGLGDMGDLMYNLRDGNAPPVIGMIDSWKGKISLKLVFDFEPNDDTFKKAMDQTELIANQLGNSYVLKPRGGEFHGTFLYSQTATKATVEVSPDGNTYKVVIPVYMAPATNVGKIKAGLQRGK